MEIKIICRRGFGSQTTQIVVIYKGNENYTEFLLGRIFYVWLFTLT